LKDATTWPTLFFDFFETLRCALRREVRELVPLSGCPRSPIEEDVLAVVKPTPSEVMKARRKAEQALKAADEALRRAGFRGYRLSLEGSFAKDTWLRGELDLDIFALFKKDVCLKVASIFADRVAPILRSMGYIVELRYAQHPYVRFLVEDIWAELVPGCLVDTPMEVLTPVDRTPFHREFINRTLTAEQKDEVRLLKSFLKGIDVYGAEMAIQGFSGYLAELLIARYGCFKKLLEEAARWRPPVVLRLGDDKDFSQLKNATTAMVFPDPVDPRRNAAAAVSTRSLAVFVLASKLYVEKPCREYFHVFQAPPPPVEPWQWGPRLDSVAVVELVPAKAVAPDNLWGIAGRVRSILERSLSQKGFKLIHTSHVVIERGGGVKALIYLEASTARQPPKDVAMGPPAWASTRRVMGFIEKHLDIHVDSSGVLRARRRLPGLSLYEAVKDILSVSLPSSVRKIGAMVRVLRGLDAAEAVAETGGKWAWETLNTGMYWLHVVAEKCGIPSMRSMRR